MHKETKYCTLLQFIHLILIDLFCNRGVFMQSSPWWRGPNPEVGEKSEPNFAWIIIKYSCMEGFMYLIIYYSFNLLLEKAKEGWWKEKRGWWGRVGGGCRRETEKDRGEGGGMWEERLKEERVQLCCTWDWKGLSSSNVRAQQKLY